MIPKIIHYCWFGNKPKNDLVLRCIASWQKLCPDFEIKEWNESNFSVSKFPFAARMYNEKKWAFVSDYARLHILYEQGGFYLDTDMLLVQPLKSLVGLTCVLGEESPGIISAGMIGAQAQDPFIGLCKKFYDNDPSTVITIPRVLSTAFAAYDNKKIITVYPPQIFYPFDADNIHKFQGQHLGPTVIGVHLWNYSWGHPLNKFFKKIGIYRTGKRISEVLGIKNALKKLFRFI